MFLFHVLVELSNLLTFWLVWGTLTIPFLTLSLDDKPWLMLWEATVAMEESQRRLNCVCSGRCHSTETPILMPRIAACYLLRGQGKAQAAGTYLPPCDTLLCTTDAEGRAGLQCMKMRKLFPTVGEMWIKWRGNKAAFSDIFVEFVALEILKRLEPHPDSRKPRSLRAF